MTHHNLCDACETVAHCTKHGCIPLQPANTDWQAIAADQALTIALLKSELQSQHRQCVQCETQSYCERRGCIYKQPYDPSPDVRELSKWLNEQPNREINRSALARVLTHLQVQQ